MLNTIPYTKSIQSFPLGLGMAHGCCCHPRAKWGQAGACRASSLSGFGHFGSLCLCLINQLSLKRNAASSSLSFCMDAVPPESMRQHGRRLCELLEDQQELLEHDGYSDRAVNSAACICWFGSACRRLKRLSNYGFKRKKKAEAIRLLIKRAWRWHAAAVDRVTKINSRGVKFHRLSSSAAADDAEMNKEERSPVSVLALHSHEVEEESTSPSSSESTEETKNSRMLEFEESLPDCDESITISELIDRDLSESKKEWTQFEHERREVGTAIEHIIFEDIRRETALDLLLHRSSCTMQIPVDSSHYF
ncbi:uncharacterized protein LOC121998587 [Zingiber officinale]|uniref:uncharacterized protein LOC121998587 n=1 Tax=Zingiber officinale TaxID=94328 RepID=UPI001C4D7B7B|nr:uncharacterized protein LOC121998587 [Zingiber officinale]